jgi:hypothetical protein
MAAGGDREFELGPDPVGGGDQDRVLVARGLEVEQRAEAAEAGIAAGAGGCLGERLDRFDERRPGFDIDAGLAVLVAVILAPYGVLTQCRV